MNGSPVAESASKREANRDASREERRQLGLTSAIGVVISSMVGAGVYTTSGFALADLGSPWLVLCAWIVAGGIALCGAISYGELAWSFRESGGEYLFLSRALHPAAGFLAGIVSLLAGFTGAIAVAALALEAYLRGLPGVAELPNGTLATGAVLFAMGLNLWGVHWSARAQNGLVAVKLLVLIGFLGVAAVRFPAGWPGWSQATQTPVPMISEPVTLATFCMSLVWISLSYCGFNAAVYLAGEIKQPEQIVPRALWRGTGLVLVLYLLLNAVFVLVPSREQVQGVEEVALVAAETLGGAGLTALIRGVVAVSLMTSVLVMMMTGPRVYAQMAEDGLFPRQLKFGSQVPAQAIVWQAVLVLCVIAVATLQQLLFYLGVTLSLSAALTVSCLFWLPRRPGQPQWTLPAAGTFVLSTLLIAGFASSRAPWESLCGLLTILAGLGPY